ncbi:MAG: protein jag [Clostridiaceae bacterium]|nr:protein jag [Clostridiaceae bacterium]
MDHVVETTGKTVDQAVEKALEELDISLTDALIEILDEGDKGGIFGFGRQPARVRVTDISDDEDRCRERERRRATLESGHYKNVNDDDDDDDDDAEEWKMPAEERGLDAAENAALDYVEAILSGIGIHGRLESYIDEEGSLEIDISGNDCGVAIGRHGETLDAIQYLTNIVANRWMDDFLRVIVDVSGYRHRREQRLSRIANKTAERVLATGRESKLKPMTPAERRVIHVTLRDVEGISTYSEGADPRRYVVIAPSVGVEFIND